MTARNGLSHRDSICKSAISHPLCGSSQHVAVDEGPKPTDPKGNSVLPTPRLHRRRVPVNGSRRHVQRCASCNRCWGHRGSDAWPGASWFRSPPTAQPCIRCRRACIRQTRLRRRPVRCGKGHEHDDRQGILQRARAGLRRHGSTKLRRERKLCPWRHRARTDRMASGTIISTRSSPS